MRKRSGGGGPAKEIMRRVKVEICETGYVANWVERAVNRSCIWNNFDVHMNIYIYRSVYTYSNIILSRQYPYICVSTVCIYTVYIYKTQRSLTCAHLLTMLFIVVACMSKFKPGAIDLLHKITCDPGCKHWLTNFWWAIHRRQKVWAGHGVWKTRELERSLATGHIPPFSCFKLIFNVYKTQRSLTCAHLLTMLFIVVACMSKFKPGAIDLLHKITCDPGCKHWLTNFWWAIHRCHSHTWFLVNRFVGGFVATVQEKSQIGWR